MSILVPNRIPLLFHLRDGVVVVGNNVHSDLFHDLRLWLRYAGDGEQILGWGTLTPQLRSQLLQAMKDAEANAEALLA